MFLEINASTTNEILTYFTGVFQDFLPLLIILIGLMLGFFIVERILKIFSGGGEGIDDFDDED